MPLKPRPLIAPQAIPREVLYDQNALHQFLPQRHEMEQLTAITSVDRASGLSCGYRDYRPDEFWVRGHIPGFPIVPGVLLCESAAQIATFFCAYTEVSTPGQFVGFGGMDNVRFRGVVRLQDRLWLVALRIRYTPRIMVSQVQGFVNDEMVFHGEFIGVPIPRPG